MSENDLNLTIKQLIDKYSLVGDRRKSKSFGQNFLYDPSLLDKIVSCALPFEEAVDIIEVGPGPGGLTRSLLKFAPPSAKIFCIEKDKTLRVVHESFERNYSTDRLEFIYEDALKVSIKDLTSKPVFIVSNLPYNVGTHLLIQWLHHSEQILKMILLFQKEVVQRIVALPGSKEYGRLSVLCQLLCRCEKIFDISNKAFYPSPKVTSSLVKLVPFKDVSFDLKALENLSALCFQQRRKTIFNSLRRTFNKEILTEALHQSGIDPNCRPEVVPPELFLKLQTLLASSSSAV